MITKPYPTMARNMTRPAPSWLRMKTKRRNVGFSEIHLKRVRGFKAFLKVLRANIR